MKDNHWQGVWNWRTALQLQQSPTSIARLWAHSHSSPELTQKVSAKFSMNFAMYYRCHMHQTERKFCKIIKRLPWEFHDRLSQDLEVPKSNSAGCDNNWKKMISNTLMSRITGDLLKSSTLTSNCRWKTIQGGLGRCIQDSIERLVNELTYKVRPYNIVNPM